MKQWKRLIAFILAMSILFSNFPVSVRAEHAADGTCEHHTHPSESCSWRAGAEQKLCAHQHSQDCYKKVKACIHSDHQGCSYDPGDEGSGCSCPTNEETGEVEHIPDTCTYRDPRPEAPCDHECGADCYTDNLICGHSEDGLCHVTAAIEPVGCNYVCAACAEAQKPVDEVHTCICGEGEKCGTGSVKQGCVVCASSSNLEGDCLGKAAKPAEEPESMSGCKCAGKPKCTSVSASSCATCYAAGEKLAEICLGTVQEPAPEEPVCDCAGKDKCTDPAATDCPVCSNSNDLTTDCKGNTPEEPKECRCEYKCEKAEDGASCPVCSEDGAWEDCDKEPKPPECTCEYRCTEDHEDETCAYCQQAEDCKQTKVWEQKYGKVTVAIQWNDESNAFNSRYSAIYDGIVALYKGGESAGANFSYTVQDDRWIITINNIPIYEEYSETPIAYTVKQDQGSDHVGAYMAIDSGSAELTDYDPETGEFLPVEFGYDLLTGDISGNILWDSDEHPSAAFFFDTYFDVRQGDESLKDRLEYTVNGNTYSFTIRDVPQKKNDGNDVQYTLTADNVEGFSVDANSRNTTTNAPTSFQYKREIEVTETAGTKVRLNWLDGSGTDENMHKGELDLAISYTHEDTKYTITDFVWNEAAGAYVHQWTEEEKLRLHGKKPGDTGYDDIENLIIEDKGNNSLMRTLETNHLPVLMGEDGKPLVTWGAPVIEALNFTAKQMSDGVFVDCYEMEWFNGGYRMTPMMKVNFEVNVRVGNDSKEEVLAHLENLKDSGIEGDKIFALEGNNGFETQYISAAEVLSGTPTVIQVKGKQTLLYSYETLQKAYDTTDKLPMVYNIDCMIQDDTKLPDETAAEVNGTSGFALEYNNTAVPGKGGLTNTAYDGGRIILTNIGDKDYQATKYWLDDGDETERPDATYTLWRYSTGSFENASQVSVNGQYEFTLDKKGTAGANGYEVPISRLGLPRYDADGYEYTYLIREIQADSSYERVMGKVDKDTKEVTDTLPENYSGEDGKRISGDTSIYNNGAISNRRVENLPHTITKTWKAAYYQDQLRNVMVELTVSVRHVNEDASAEMQQWREHSKIYLSGFDALHSTITQTVDFPRYDHMGHEVEYKVEETDIREITMEPLSVEDDGDDQQTPAQEVQPGQSMTTVRTFVLPMNQRTLDEESIEGATDYFVSTSTTTVETDQDGMTHHKTVIINELEGETAYFIRKTWDMNPSNVTFTLSQTGKNGTSIYGSEEIKTTDYTTDSPRDSGWIRGVWDGESWELPRYDEDGNLYTYMVLEQDNNSYESEYIYGSEENKDGKEVFVYGHDVDGDGKRERNAAMIHNSPIGLNRYINVRKVWYDDSANTDRGPVMFQIEATDVTPSCVIYGENGLLGSYVEVNEQSNWWDKVDVTMFLYNGALYTGEGFAADAGYAPAAEDLYTGGFCVTEVSVGTSKVGDTANTAGGFKTVQKGNTLFAVMYNHPNATGSIQHDDNLYYNATGAVAPITVSNAQAYAITGRAAEDESQQNYVTNEFYTVTNLRIGSYNLTVEKTWQDDLTEGNETQTTANNYEVVRPEGTFTLSCTEYPDSLVQVENENNDYIVVSKVLHPNGQQPIQNNVAAGEDAVQTLKGEKDKETIYYYNLPLYDGAGKVIHYRVDETLPDGVKYQKIDTGVRNNYETMTAGKLEATQGFTNKPQNTYGVQFHLLWLDKYRQQNNQRPDVYLKLYGMSGDQAQPVALPYAEYHWTHNAQSDTSADAWTYRFENLPEFDDKGQKITYFARIFTSADAESQNYIDLQYGAGQNTSLGVWNQGNNRLTDVDVTDNTYKVSLKDPENNGIVFKADDGSWVMMENNTFVYQIKDEVEITGKKIWDAIPEGFPAEDLPILNFVLRNKNQTGEIRAVVWKCESENYTYTFAIRQVGICDKRGNLIKLEDNAEAAAYWNALVEKGLVTSLPYGSLLPRFDEEGKEDTYHLDEEIYAYTTNSEINKNIAYEDHWGTVEDVYQLRNTFNKRNSNQSEITISKSWLKNHLDIDPQTFVFPEKVTFKLYRFYYDLYDQNYAPLTKPAELPNGAANAPGDPIAIVEITKEELMAGEDVVKSFGEQWVYAPNGTPFIYFIGEEKLDGYDPESMELPNSVIQAVPKVEEGWPEEIGTDWYSDAFTLQKNIGAGFEMPAKNDYVAYSVELSGAKNWDDFEDSQKTRPSELQLELMRKTDGVVEHKVATITLKNDGTATVQMEPNVENVAGRITATVDKNADKGKWSYTISNLDKFYSTTKAWSYKVKEIAPNEYTGVDTDTEWKSAGSGNIEGMDLTNELKTRVTATKNWEKLNAGVEVPSIMVALQVSVDGGQTWKFAENYFTGEKAWSSMPVFDQTLTTGNTNVAFENLPKGFGAADGNYQDFMYRVVETEIDGTKVVFNDNGNYAENNGTKYTITNGDPTVSNNTHSNTITNTPDDEKTTQFSVTKIWTDKDYNNAFYTRGGCVVGGNREQWSVTFDLWRYQTNAYGHKIHGTDEQVMNRDGGAFITLTANQSSDVDSIDDLAAKTADGKVYVYYAKEQGITDNGNYFGSYEDTPAHSGNSSDGFATAYTNDLITTQLSVTKVWYSHDNKTPLFQPDELAVTLWQSSKNVTERNITEWYQFKDPDWGSDSWDMNGDKWTMTFTDLPKYDPQGDPYTYMVKEERLDGYLDPIIGTTATPNNQPQTQTVTNIPTLFYMDKISTEANNKDKLKDVELVFRNSETGVELTWSRIANESGGYKESFSITSGGKTWSGNLDNDSVPIQGLPVGTYELTAETKIPYGYTNSAVGTSFTLDGNGEIAVEDADFESSEVEQIVNTDYVKYCLKVKDKPTEVNLIKKGKDDTILEAGYLFSVKPVGNKSKFADNADVKYIAGSGVTIPDDGEALAKGDLIVGHTYVLKEVEAPNHYLRSFGSVTFKLKENGTMASFTGTYTNNATASYEDVYNKDKTFKFVEITFNDPDYGVVLLKTSSKDNSVALEGAIFELQEWDGSAWVPMDDATTEEVDAVTVTTGSGGLIQLNSVTHKLLLSKGTTIHKYRLLETVAAPGYELILDEQGNSISSVEFYAMQNATTGDLEIYQDGEQVSVDSDLNLGQLSMTNVPIEMEFAKKDMGDALTDPCAKSGVKFTLEAVGNDEIPDQEDITDVHGKIHFGPASYDVTDDNTFMVIGGQTYRLTEDVPAGYETTQITRVFTVTKDGKFDFEGKPETFTIENERIPGKVELVKQDSKGNVMDGVTFTIQDSKNNAYYVKTGRAYTASYDADDNLKITEVTEPSNATTGKLTIENLAWGDYSLEERVPTGYKTPGFSRSFNVNGNNAVNGVVFNSNNTITNTPVEVKVWKVDANNTNTPIPGAVYKLYDGNGNEITSNTAYGDTEVKLYKNGAEVTMPMWSWDSTSGSGSAFRLAPGTYTLVEDTVPVGFEKADDITITVNADGTVTSDATQRNNVLLAVDNQIKFELVKKDSVSGNALDGVTFEVTCDGVSLGEKMTRNDGKLTFGYANANPAPDFAVEIGKTYTVQEIATVNGYELMAASFSFRVDAKGTVIPFGTWADCVTVSDDGLTITATNTPIDITLVKKAAVDGIAPETILANVEFKLTGTVDGNPVEYTDTTDPTGKLYFKHVSDSANDHTFPVVGGVTYTLSEKEPDGYADIADIVFTVTTDGKLEMTKSEMVSLSPDRETLTIMNERLPGSVKLTKQDAQGYTMNGVEFTLKHGSTELLVSTGNSYTAEVKDGAITLEDTGNTIGTLVIDGLPWGDYTLTETRPVGYKKEATYARNFTIDGQDVKKQNNTVVVLQEITVINTPVQINVMKVDANDEAPYTALDGAEYDLYKLDGDVETKIEGSYDAGEYTLYNGLQQPVDVLMWNWNSDTGTGTAFRLEEGTYVLKEETPPAGYEKAEDITFKIDENGNLTDVSTAIADNKILAKDTKISFELVKKDAVNGEPLDGVTFKLSTQGRDDQTAVTHNGGKLTFGHEDDADFAVEVGKTYTLTETKTIYGYELLKKSITFTVNPDGTIQPGWEGTWKDTDQNGNETGATAVLSEDALVITVNNARTLGEVILTKSEFGTGNMLDGITFTLYKKTEGGWFQNFLNFLTGNQYKVAASFNWSGERTDGDITENSDMLVGEYADGKLYITGLEWGTYKLVETNSDGYVLNDATANQLGEFVIGKNKTNNEVLIYEPKVANSPIRFTVIKTNADGSTELPGEVFALYHYDNGNKTALKNTVKWYKEEQNGNDWFEGSHLPKGDYLLEETTPPVGYQVGASVVFTVNADGSITNIRDINGKPAANAEVISANSIFSIKVMDTPIRFKLIKQDFLNAEDLLEGVEFTLTSGNETQVGKTDDEGELTFGAEGEADFVVAVGKTYTLTETDTIYGYELLKKSITFTVQPDGTIQPGWEGTWKDSDENGNETGATAVLSEDALVITATNTRTLGKVVLTKIDSENREKINGVTFTLYKLVSGDTWYANFLNFLTGKQYEIAAEFKWDEERVTAEDVIDVGMQIGEPKNGILEISGLTWGGYKLEEKAADGYILQEDASTRTYKFTIGKDIDGDEVLVYENEVENTPNKFTLIKVDLDGEELQGEEYTLAAYNAETGTETPLDKPAKWERKTSDTEIGLRDWYEGTRLPKGDYILKEVTPPSGYRIAAPIVFTVTGDGQIVNLRQLVNGKLVKADNAYISDDATKIYAKDEMTEFSFNKVGLINEILTDSSVTMTTKDPNAAIKLAGVKFTAYSDMACTTVVKPLLNADANGAVTADGMGVVTFKGLPLGSYYIKETGTVDGYVLLDTVFQVDITSEDEITLKNVAENTVINDVYRGQITFNKVSELDATKAIAGAEYGLFANGSLIAKAVSQGDGRVTFDGLLMDVNYVIKELKVPTGSYVSKNPVKFHFEETNGTVKLIIDDDGDGTITEGSAGILWNEPQTRVSILKVDNNSKPLAGAKLQIQDLYGNVITLYDKDGNAFTSWISTKKPLEVTGQLKAGKVYRLVELKAPHGYQLAKPVRFIIGKKKMEPDQNVVIEVTMINTPIGANPKTGDDTPIHLLMATAAFSGLALLDMLFAFIFGKRKRRTKNEDA